MFPPLLPVTGDSIVSIIWNWVPSGGVISAISARTRSRIFGSSSSGIFLDSRELFVRLRERCPAS